MDEARIDISAAGEGRGAHENHGAREAHLAAHLRPLVVKIGSSTLTTSESKIDYAFLDDVARQVARVREAGFSPIIVTSAAIACRHAEPSGGGLGGAKRAVGGVCPCVRPAWDYHVACAFD